MNKNIFFILLLLPLCSHSQVVSDAKLWTAITINKKVNDFEFSFSEEFRMDENVSHVDKFFSELGAEYKIMKRLFVRANYRYSRDNNYENKNYEMNHRIDLGLTYKHKIDNLRLSFRTKIQTKSAPSYENNATYSRNKLVAKYKLENNLSPFISYEFFYQFNDERVINRTRFSLGTDYQINDKSSVKAYYMFENKFNTKNLEHNHVYGLSYSFDL